MGTTGSSFDSVLSDSERAPYQKAQEQHFQSQGHVHGGRLDALYVKRKIVKKFSSLLQHSEHDCVLRKMCLIISVILSDTCKHCILILLSIYH